MHREEMKLLLSPIAIFYVDNEIDGTAFGELTEDDVKTIIKPLGVVKKIMRLQRSIFVQLVSKAV